MTDQEKRNYKPANSPPPRRKGRKRKADNLNVAVKEQWEKTRLSYSNELIPLVSSVPNVIYHVG